MRVFAVPDLKSSNKKLVIAYFYVNCTDDFIQVNQARLIYNDNEMTEIFSSYEEYDVVDWYIWYKDKRMFYEYLGAIGIDIQTSISNDISLLFKISHPYVAAKLVDMVRSGSSKYLVTSLDVDHIFGTCEAHIEIPTFPIWAEYDNTKGTIDIYTETKEDAVQLRLMT